MSDVDVEKVWNSIALLNNAIKTIISFVDNVVSLSKKYPQDQTLDLTNSEVLARVSKELSPEIVSSIALTLLELKRMEQLGKESNLEDVISRLKTTSHNLDKVLEARK